MKAYVLHDIGDIKLENVSDPLANENEVIVKVKTAGICGSDIPRIYKTGAYLYPLIPGHEFSGVVADVGKNVNSDLVGKRVGIFPLIPCRQCYPCKEKKYEMCRNYSYLGSRRDGGFAEYVAVPKDNLIELPDNVSFETAAMLEPMAVAAHAVRNINFLNHDSVVVCGLGTIGTLVTMMLKESGIENILVIGNKESQKEKILQFGISETNYCDSKTTDTKEWILDKTDGNGADVFFECVGKNETLSEAIDSAAPGGRVKLIGNPYSDMKLDKKLYWKILRNQLTVSGSWNSSFTGEKNDDWNYVLERLNKKSIKPELIISHTFDFDNLIKGFGIMRDKTEDYIKVMGIL